MLSSDVFRFCFMRSGNVVEFDPEPDEGTVYQGRATFKGPISAMAKTMLSMVFPSKVSNYSVRLEKNLGNFDELTGLYNGCLASVQRNEFDASWLSFIFRHF